MTASAKAAVLKSGDWLTAAEIAKLSGRITAKQVELILKWQMKGKIFAIDHRDIAYIPAYGLDPDAGFRPRKALATVIGILQDRRGGWGMAYWFESANSFLGGKTPKSQLASDPERVIAAAKDDAVGITHG